MDNLEFHNYRLDLEAECNKILEDRGPAYAGEGGDRLANFRLIAKLLDNFHVETSGEMGTWAVYFLKHVFSILAYIGQRTEGEEKIEGRIVDARNYLDLFYGMVRDAEKCTCRGPSMQPCGPHCLYPYTDERVPLSDDLGPPCACCGYRCRFPDEHTGKQCCNCHQPKVQPRYVRWATIKTLALTSKDCPFPDCEHQGQHYHEHYD